MHDDFFARLKAAVEGAADRRPDAQDVLYGPMIDERFLERFESEWLGLDPRPPQRPRLDRAPGASPPTTRARASSATTPRSGLFVHPTLVDGVRVDDDLANTETFGPLVGVASFGDWDEAIALANGHGYGLSAAIYTTNPQQRLPLSASASAPAWSASTTRPAAPRRTCPSAATASRATARASRASG